MWFTLPQRDNRPERMDVEPLADLDATRILGALERVNRYIGGVRATMTCLRRYARRWAPGQTIRIIDWGTGGADVPRALVRWARRAGFRLEVVAVDNNPAVLSYARASCRDYPEIRLIESDLLGYPETDLFDYALSSLVLHHLPDDGVIELLRKSDRLARRGMIMNDLIRSRRAWLWIWSLTRIGHAHPIVQNDGPLSVARAFRVPELELLAQRAGVSYLTAEKHFGYRLTLSGEKRP